jgi:hypothetical protein
MDVSATVNGGIVMDVSPKVQWRNCDGRIDEDKLVAL